MALWKESSSSRKDTVADPTPPASAAAPEGALSYAPPSASVPSRGDIGAMVNGSARERSESVIGPDLAIEGSITGAGSVRLAGRFTGDVAVEGAVTIERGAHLAGGVRAQAVSIAGELEGNVIEASRVEVLASGMLVGDLKAETLTIAAGSRVRGRVECGWGDASVAHGGRAGGRGEVRSEAGGRMRTPASAEPVASNGDTPAAAG